MLKVTDIAPANETKLALDGHVVDVQLTHWENDTNLYWRISHSPRTLAEIWVNEYTRSIVSVTLVVIDTVEIVDQTTPIDESVEIVSGWPCVDTSIWKRDPDRDRYEERFLDVSDTLSAALGSTWLRIGFGDTQNTSPKRYIQSGQVSFGIDQGDHLASVTLSDLSPDDMQMARYALIRSESQDAVGCRRIFKRLIPFSF